MASSQGVPGKTKGPLFTGITLGLAWGFIFALTDFFCGILKSFPWFRVEGALVALKTELYGIAVYLPSVLVLAVLLSAPFLIINSLKLKIRLQDRHEEIISGILAFILFFSLLESTADLLILWKMIPQAAVFLAVTVPAGVGIGAVIAFSKTRYGLNAFFSVVVLCGFSFNHALLALLLKARIDTHGLIIAISMFAIPGILLLWMGLKSIKSGRPALKWIWLTLCLLLILSPLLTLEPMHSTDKVTFPPKNPPNIIVVISDACRADAIGIYGGDNNTPNIDRLGREGVIFRNAFSQSPWTLPSMLSAISSRYPSVLQRGRLYRVPDSVETLAEHLKSHGYFTKLLMGNYSLGRSSGFVQGFDQFEVYNQYHLLHRLLPLPIFHRMHYLYRRALDLPMFPDLTETITREAVKLIESHDPSRPFFLWLHYMDPHDPYDPPQRFLERGFDTKLAKPFSPVNPWHIDGDRSDPQAEEIRTGYFKLSPEDKEYIRYLYRAEVRYLDEKIKELIEKIRDAKLDNTIVIFTSDHGEEFWEHGSWGHGQSLYNELLHVPLILWGADMPARRIETPVELIDLAPTILELAELPVPEEYQGGSLLDLITGRESGYTKVFAEALAGLRENKSIQDESRKLIWDRKSRLYEMYDISVDEAETMDIYSPDDPQFRRLDKELWLWADENVRLHKDVSGMKVMPGVEEEIERRLKALGYIK